MLPLRTKKSGRRGATRPALEGTVARGGCNDRPDSSSRKTWGPVKCSQRFIRGGVPEPSRTPRHRGEGEAEREGGLTNVDGLAAPALDAVPYAINCREIPHSLRRTEPCQTAVGAE